MKANDFRRQLPRLAAIGALAFTVLPANPLRAASIFWGTPTLIAASTDVSTTGSLVYAYTFGNASVNPALVNGVPFATFPVPNSSGAPVTKDSVTLAVGAGQLFVSSETGAGSTAAPFTSLSNAYQGLLEGDVSTSVFNGTLTLTLGGLINGQAYLVEFWTNNSALTTLDRRTTYTAGNTVTLDDNNTNADGGVGQWVTGTFTADATTTQVVTLTASVPLGLPAINAFQVRAVPEPSSALLLLSGAALGLCRRTRRKEAEINQNLA